MQRCPHWLAVVTLLSTTTILVAAGEWLDPSRPQCLAAGANRDDRPNIVVLVTDDQRSDALGCMGHSIVKTPQIDRLAQGGVVFDNCFVTTSACWISRASIFTGQWGSRHGHWDSRISFTETELAQTYPALLKEAGYHIGFIGKWGVGKPPAGLFDYNRGYRGQGRYFNQVDGETVHLTKQMGDQALEFLDGVDPGKPFCLSVSFKAPHRQDADPSDFLYPPDLAWMYREVTVPSPRLSALAFFDTLPDFFHDCENRRRWKVHFGNPELVQHSIKAYYRLISGVDLVVGRIMDKLDQRNLAQDTIVIYSSDNGFYLGDRGLSAKAFPHDVSIRVPLLIHDPRLPAQRRGMRCDKIVLNVDLAPTILQMAGLEVSGTMQGESLVPLVEGRDPDWRTEFYYEELCELERVFIPRSVAVRNKRFKYIRFIDADPLYEELYDLSSDDAEEHNLVDQPKYARTLEQMRRKCESWRQRVK